MYCLEWRCFYAIECALKSCIAKLLEMNGLGLTNFIYNNIEKIIHIFPGEQHQQIVKTNKISNS